MDLCLSRGAVTILSRSGDVVIRAAVGRMTTTLPHPNACKYVHP